jgi:peptidoglycan hydrolase CwlO-like protein
MKSVNKPLNAILMAAAMSTCISTSAIADDANKIGGHARNCVDWTRLNLTPQQSQQIAQLDAEWQTKYSALQPQIIQLQRKLERLLPDPKSDPLEIMATQQNIARMKEQLRNEATTNYLRKRSVLLEPQQHQLEAMLHQMVMERQRPSMPSTQADQQGGITNIVNKIKWAIEPH